MLEGLWGFELSQFRFTSHQAVDIHPEMRCAQVPDAFVAEELDVEGVVDRPDFGL